MSSCVFSTSSCFSVEEEEEGGEQDIVHVLGSMVMGMLVKYWIYVCSGMFFIVTFEGNIVMYKIIYMMMLLFCVAVYQVPRHTWVFYRRNTINLNTKLSSGVLQVNFEWWRKILKYFWMTVVMYTMVVLTIVYTFQFEGSKEVWMRALGVNQDR